MQWQKYYFKPVSFQISCQTDDLAVQAIAEPQEGISAFYTHQTVKLPKNRRDQARGPKGKCFLSFPLKCFQNLIWKKQLDIGMWERNYSRRKGPPAPIPEGFWLLWNVLYWKKRFSKHKHIILLMVLPQPRPRVIQGADVLVIQGCVWDMRGKSENIGIAILEDRASYCSREVLSAVN